MLKLFKEQKSDLIFFILGWFHLITFTPGMLCLFHNYVKLGLVIISVDIIVLFSSVLLFNFFPWKNKKDLKKQNNRINIEIDNLHCLKIDSNWDVKKEPLILNKLFMKKDKK